MKLRSALREHYTSNDNQNWKPKVGFATEDEIKEKTGYNPAECNVYKCSICDLLHISQGSEKKYR